jgi:tetratricopeptide (TPR) repeat protein
MGALGQAENFLRQAQRLAPTDQRVLQELAHCLSQQERLGEALEIYRQIEAANPDNALVKQSIGSILDKLGRNDEAEKTFSELIELKPDYAPNWVARGHALRFSGRTEEAISSYRKAIALDDEYGEAWWGLADIKSKVLTDEDVAKMEQSLAIAIDERNTAPLNFSLARGYHDRKDYERAFKHYVEGNRIRAESLDYQANELTDEVTDYTNLIGTNFFKRTSSFPPDSPRPIFVVSLPRSGSTLLEQMLGSHPEIAPAGELPYIPALVRAALEHHTKQRTITVPQVIISMGDEEAAMLGQEYLRRAAYHYPEASTVFVDKLPHNWSNVLFIKRILPHAKIIDIRRPAMDCCFSNFTQSFSRAHASSFRLQDIGQCYVDYVRLMDHLEKVAPGVIHHVRYDRLIEDPEPELRAIFEYLGIEWDDAPLNFHKLDRVVRTPSAEQVRQPLNRKGVGRWKPYEQWLGQLREVLGPLADA